VVEIISSRLIRIDGKIVKLKDLEIVSIRTKNN